MQGQSSGDGGFDVGGRSFDHYARLVRRFVGVPVALVTLVEEDRQVFPGVLGLPEPWLAARETPLTHSLCRYVVADGAPLVAEDVREVPRLADSLAVPDLGVVGYAGWPLTDASGRAVGSLCAIDTEPRAWTEEDLAALEDLARACSAELQHAAAEVAATHELARSVVAAADVAMVVVDDRQRVLLVNDHAEALAATAGFRFDAPPHAGPEVWRADRAERVAEEAQVVPRAVRGEAPSREIEWFGPPGDQVAVVATARRLEGVPGSWRTLVVLHDVTELAMAQELRERVSATVAHEMRTPLTAILGYLELLGDDLDADDPADAATVRSLERIRRSADSLVDRIGRVHDTSPRRRHHGLRATDVTDLVRGVLESFGPPTAPPGSRLRLDAEDQQWANVEDARIEQAVENLVANALKYSGPDGHVHVTVRARADDVEVLVADTGAGMTPDEVARAFDPYWRSSAARGSSVRGLGLGLPLVREIAAEHHGRVDIDSAPGRGTTVTLTLPRVPI